MVTKTSSSSGSVSGTLGRSGVVVWSLSEEGDMGGVWYVEDDLLEEVRDGNTGACWHLGRVGASDTLLSMMSR